MIVIMNWFCGKVDQQKALDFISTRDFWHPQAEFDPVQNLSTGFVEQWYKVVITTKLLHQFCSWKKYCSCVVVYVMI